MRHLLQILFLLYSISSFSQTTECYIKEPPWRFSTKIIAEISNDTAIVELYSQANTKCRKKDSYILLKEKEGYYKNDKVELIKEKRRYIFINKEINKKKKLKKEKKFIINIIRNNSYLHEILQLLDNKEIKSFNDRYLKEGIMLEMDSGDYRKKVNTIYNDLKN